MNLLNKIAVSISTVALVATVFIAPSTALGATAGGVYSTPDGTVWFVTKDMQKRPFTSAGAFLSYGFLNFSQVQPADASVTALPTGSFIAPADGKIFCATETKGSDVAGECALITGSQKASFTSAAVFAAQGHSFERAMYGDSSFLSKTSNIDNGSAAHLPGVLVNNGGTVQMVVSGGLWGIPSIEVFNSWGYSFADVVPANSGDTAKAQVGVIPARMAGELTPTGTTGPVTPGPGGTFDPNGGTQGSINTITSGSPDKNEVKAGETDVEIYALDFDMDNDGPLQLQSADFWFSEADAGDHSSKPWDYFTEVTLMVNGSAVKTVDADSSSDWSTKSNGKISTVATTNEYRIRFNGLSAVLSSDEINTVSLAVSTHNNIDSEDQGADWYVEMHDFRTLDESGLVKNENAPTINGNATALEQSFEVVDADTAALTIGLSADEIKATLIEVNKNSDTNGVRILNFFIEETADVDATVQEVTATFVTPGAENSVLRRAYLFRGNTQLSSKAMTANGEIVFNNLNIDIDADSKEEFNLRVDIRNTDAGVPYAEGATLSATVTGITEAMDANGNDEDDINVTGTAASKTHELRTEGIRVELDGAPTAIVNTVDGPNNDLIEFQWKVNVTAFGNKDMYINADNADVVSADAAANVDTIFGLEYSGGAVLTGVTGTITATSGPANVTGVGGDAAGEVFYRITAGTTRTFTITVTGTNQTNAKQVRALLNNIEWTAKSPLDAVVTADINAYSFNLGEDAATPFRLVN